MNPDKTKRNFSIRLPEEVIKILDEIADNTGHNITRNNVVEQACEWYVRTYRAHGNRAMTQADVDDLLAYIRAGRPRPLQMAAETPGHGCASPELGSSPAQPKFYPKPIKRKSSK